ncbi:MAG: methyltransferase domain-containing protein [Bacteroidota bacterium]
MGEQIRKPFQGVSNIIRFNWHFYATALIIIISLAAYSVLFPSKFNSIIQIFAVCVFFATFNSLFASYYIYDCSNLYSLNWINNLQVTPNAEIVNINAGFDETSDLIQQKYPNSILKVYDFYNPFKHTEISIERARKAYPPYPKTQIIDTTKINIPHQSTDLIFLIFAAHEIRDKQEQILFFKQLKPVLKPDGKIIVVEHNRDFYNFIVYNIGIFHFFSPKRWKSVFKNSELNLIRIEKITPFINVYYLN